jgi:ribokinase
LQAAGVDTVAVGEIDGISGTAVIVVSPEGENAIVVNSGANAALSPDDIDANRKLIREAGMVLTQLEIPLQTVAYLARTCARVGVPLLLDPAPAKDLPLELVGQAQWFTPNETEAAFYSGCDESASPREIAHALLNQGWPAVALKLGARGVYLAERNGKECEIPSFKVRAMDTTAAGDAFNGSFATGMMLGMTATESAKLATAAAAISVTRAGAQPSMPTMEEVECLLKVATM